VVLNASGLQSSDKQVFTNYLRKVIEEILKTRRLPFRLFPCSGSTLGCIANGSPTASCMCCKKGVLFGGCCVSTDSATLQCQALYGMEFRLLMFAPAEVPVAARSCFSSVYLNCLHVLPAKPVCSSAQISERGCQTRTPIVARGATVNSHFATFSDARVHLVLAPMFAGLLLMLSTGLLSLDFCHCVSPSRVIGSPTKFRTSPPMFLH